MTNKKKLEKRDIRKKRQRLLKKRRKKYGTKDIEEDDEVPDDKMELIFQRETKLYWIRAVTGAVSALVGRLFLGLVGWWLLLFMVCMWFGFPFLVNFVLLGYGYDKEDWNWKNIIKPGIGIYFFLFMIVGVFIHTLLQFV
ncbi:MAG: hypothetical protein R6U96_11765 [Promethearchaeia archaeon]